jgi:hypothetical protein
MLGNELESMFLPSAIVLVEGESDVIFISKLVQMHIQDRKVAVVGVHGEGNILDKLNFLTGTFCGELGKSPYQQRIFIVLDKQHSVRVERIVGRGIAKENITILMRNGIEYYYPKALLSEIFCCHIDDVEQILIEHDPIVHGGITKSKKELAQLVANRINSAHEMDSELACLVGQIKARC